MPRLNKLSSSLLCGAILLWVGCREPTEIAPSKEKREESTIMEIEPMPIEFRGNLLDVIQDGQGPLPSADTVAELEHELGCSLPTAYKSFLLKHIGGYFVHETIFTSVHRIKDEGCTVPMRLLFGMRETYDHYYSLSQVNRMSRKRIGFRKTFIEFAESEWQDSFCFETAPADYGAVYFVEKNEGQIVRVANDFDDFLSKLTVTPNRRSQLFDEMTADDPEVFRMVEAGSLEDVEAYLRAGGSANVCNPNGVTLLMCAVNCEWPKIVRHLIDCGADVNARTHRGTTALVRAAFMQSVDEVSMLLEAGANPVWTGHDGKTLMEQMEYVRGTHIWNLLRDAGAK